jgi:hypothetical protein
VPLTSARALRHPRRYGDVGTDLGVISARRFLPAKFTAGDPSRLSMMCAQIRELHKDFRGLSKPVVRKLYMDIVQGWKVYGSVFYSVQPAVRGGGSACCRVV